MAYQAIDSLLETLTLVLKQCHHPDINQILFSINDESVALKSKINSEKEEQIKEAAATTKEMIEYFLSEDNPLYDRWMRPKSEHLWQLTAVHLYFKSTLHSFMSTPGDISAPASKRRRTVAASQDVIIGFDEDVEVMKKWITGSNQPSRLQVLSIVGTGGIGKTTLAKLVYNHESITKHFDIRAWVTVSQDYSVASIVSKLLASLEEGGFPVEREGQREIPAESLLKTYLNRGSFLIVIDDICSKKAWDDIKTIFPNTCSSSRVMLTTRLHEVADYVNSSIPVHSMRLLDAHQSWDLLKKKVFLGQLCPIQLEDVGRKIVKICGGLPLSIVMVAGILSMLPKTRCLWKQCAPDHGTLETIITLSYKYLPDCMKECFIYMGGFPEDYEIRVTELIKLWIGEGFFKCPTTCKSLEEEATEVLDNLVERSLVLVSKRKFDSKIKSCILHDIVRDFCIKEAAREKFLLSVMDYLPTPILRKHFLPRLLKIYGRISASSHDLDLKDSAHSLLTHSIICVPKRGYKCVSSMTKFSSLKVFHVLSGNDDWEWEPSGVLDLIYLTYIASNIPVIPSNILKFENLQTLNIYRSEVVLPAEIWMLRQLRHLMAFSFHSPPQPNKKTLPLEKLQVMSLMIDLMCSKRMMETIPHIKKLGICCRSSMDGNIYNLGYLRQLENLKLVSLEKLNYVSRHMNLMFPRSLKKLTLCGLRLLWEDMRIIGSLPSLQVLKLRNYACDDSIWRTTQGEFEQLESFLLDESNLLEWVTKSSHFPKPKSLALHRCPYLNEIPPISTLELIKVDGSNKSLVESAREIEKTRKCIIQVCHSNLFKAKVRYSNTFSTQQRKLAEDAVVGSEEDLSCSPTFSFSSPNLDHLPNHLKECFLYMAGFPEDYEIRVSEIIKLWVAEGLFGLQTETKSLEEEAEDRLEDLVLKSLVLVTRRKADGKIKSFRLHNMLRNFCIREAIQQNFFLPLTISRRDLPNTVLRRDFQRMSVRWYDLKDSMHSSTILCIPREGFWPKDSVHDFTSLRVLHVLRNQSASKWELGGSFDHIHLTYLASNIPTRFVPPAISNLQNLQTLIIYRHGVYLPKEIWRMPKLRHLMAFSFHPLPNPEAADLPLENLQTLCLVRDFVCSQSMVVMIPNIKKLGLCYSGQNVETGHHLDNLAQLLHLEELKLEMPTSFWTSLPVFPRSLKKLNLSRGGLPWRDMTIIGSLPNLQVLKLRNDACLGEEWTTTDGEFRQLRFLLIDESRLQNWRAETVPFPRLQRLMLHRCQYLSEIPREIADIATLELIEVDNHSLWWSAKRMQKGSQKNGIDKFQVRVS